MGTTPLRRFLQSLCDHSCWNYAVFWKLQQQSQMLLMWEDGYVGTLQVEDSLENMLAETSCVGLDETSSSNTYNGTFGGDAVELAVAYMSSFQYTLGDGIVGDVAYSGNCRWVFVDMKSLGKLNALPFPEHGDEWSLQFAAGVKTILLVPVVPYGVLQLGSLEQCSIDGLLDRTVKHMLFLQSVDDHANKLRQCVQPEKVASVPMSNRISEDKGSQNGASWAIELGGDLKLCPILVEDLQYPGHMIIEMICEESIRFLEIAEVIHGLNLTILKGVMEKHSGNSWARYIVEASKGFQRLDIFWPLMKLLQQQQRNPLSSKI